MFAWVLAATAAFSCSAPTIVAHRGGMDSSYPENTLPAFEHAVAVGSDAIELDLRATRDGEVVVLHDRRVNRTTNGRGLVHKLPWTKVERLDTGDGITVPTLSDVLARADDLGVELLYDIKPAPRLNLEKVVQETAKHNRIERVIFGVRSLDDHARLARAHPELRFLGFVPRTRHIDGFLDAGVEIVRLWPHWVRRWPEMVQRVHDAGAQVWVTAGKASPEQLKELAALGVDGLLTDRPGDAVAGTACP